LAPSAADLLSPLSAKISSCVAIAARQKQEVEQDREKENEKKNEKIARVGGEVKILLRYRI
jgi:hypothetical protein